MADQKAENLLNLALETPEAEREKSGDLNVGYDEEERTWEVIVKYSGDLWGALEKRFPVRRGEAISKEAKGEDLLEPGSSGTVTVRELLGGFAIVTAPEGLVREVIDIPEVEYAEMPKRFYFGVNQGRAASCLAQIQRGPEGLSGRGVLVAVIDSGLDLTHGDFRNEDGSSRVLAFEDQQAGRIYTKEEIDRELLAGTLGATDLSGHGTAVAAIAAGNGRESNGRYRGVAYESDLLAVRLGTPRPDGFPRTTQVMEGIDFAVRTALELSRPLAVNLSFGNTYGSHDGNGLLERYIDTVAVMGKSVFVVGNGNEGDTGSHSFGVLKEGEETAVEFSVSPYETGFGIQLWKSYEDEFEIFLQSPDRRQTEPVSRGMGSGELRFGNTKALVYYGEPGPFQMAQEIYFDLIPGDRYIDSGIWRFLLRGRRIVEGRYDFWLPSAGSLNQSTRFLRPGPETTLTIPATALRPVSVGAYDDGALTYAPFSGRGDTRRHKIQKPDLAAPGVGIVTARNGGGYAPVTGTSFAAPFVTGAAALLMEWGILLGNDPYLYGDKVKAYLRKGAVPLPGAEETPNPRTGYGALCVENSFPSEYFDGKRVESP